ncbi:S49 family peptidase [Vulgatibacter sp.]|uniref:S49 family peptidase n=1 Tax=Vulgatibacter sp. TaxID=1971226 RepID=UPI0035648847
MKSYPRTVAAVLAEPWAILPEKLEAIAELIQLKADGVMLSDEQIEARLAGSKVASVARRAGDVAVLPVTGVISQRMNLLTEFSGGTSTEKLAANLRSALADDSIKAIVLDVDSPGGAVSGVEELAAEIQGARGGKPIIASINSLAASAAYWIASAADEVTITPGGQAGSIGVYTMHVDQSVALETAGVRPTLVSAGKFKTEGNPFGPLSEEARNAMQARVDEYYGLFVDAVARGRGVRSSDVRSGFGEGRTVGAKEAVAQGMADRIETLQQTLARLGVRGGLGVRGPARAEETQPAPRATAFGRLRRQIELDDEM